MPETVVLLHGFSATRRAWDGVIEGLDPERYRPLALDLPGHGSAVGYPPPITFDGCVQHVLGLAPERFVLCGYSLGGRVALNIALAAPQRVQRLILISTSPGIQDTAERAVRRRSDGLLAEELEAGPFEEFIERWRTQPLFAAEADEVRELARADQRRNQPRALADVLRGIGTGEMESLWDKLIALQMPVSLLAGERDHKYVTIAQRMLGLLPDARLSIVEGGHGLPLENPAAVRDALASIHRAV